MDRQIDEIQESLANICGEIETYIIEEKYDKARQLANKTKKELSGDYQSNR